MQIRKKANLHKNNINIHLQNMHNYTHVTVCHSTYKCRSPNLIKTYLKYMFISTNNNTTISYNNIIFHIIGILNRVT